MKKNFLIMMIMVLCAGFTFAQNHNTVRGFVPGAAGNQTYAVFGQMFGDIDLGANPYQAAEGLAQAQIVGDTLETVVGCGDSLSIGEFILTVADVQKIVDEFAADPTRPRDTFLTIQHPNAAIYNYDQLLVLHLFVCPCTVDDADGNTYDVIAIDNTHCWTKSNMRTTTNCAGEAVETMSYTSEIVSSLNVDTFGLLYKWNQAMTGSDCDSIYKTGICPCGWHLPTAAETARILEKNTDDLRSAEGDYWVVAENITNLTKFSAQPSGYYKGLAERFEGYHSEADFWFADNDSTCKPNYFQILYYCDKPKQEPRNDTADAMSVRCVLDMIYDYNIDNPTPNPNPTPTPTPTPTPDCPFTVSEIYQMDNNGYAVDVQNTDVFNGQNEVYFEFYDASGEYVDGSDQITPTSYSVPGSTTVTYYVAAPDLVDYPEATSYKIVFRFNLKEAYFACSNSDGAYESTKVVTIPGTEPINPPVGDLCPSASYEAQSSNYIVFHVENLNFVSEISISFGVYNDDSNNPLTTVEDTISADEFDANGNYILDYNYTTSFSYLSGTFNVTPNTMTSGCTDVQLPFSSVQN